MANENLRQARAAKNDEFYTQWADIEREMIAYLDYDPDVFRGKTILLPCDDPEWSNFTKFFALHMEEYGIKKLISTSYAPRSNPAFDQLQPSLFDVDNPYGEDDPQFDPEKAWERGRVFVLEQKDVTGDGRINIDDLRWEYLEDDGDFRKAEVTALRDEADMIITNPPFSLFRDFIGWLQDGDVQFSIIGSNNAITYKEVFPLIQANQLWLGATGNDTDMVFEVPANLADRIKPSDREKARKLGYEGNFTRLGNSCWLTNIQHGKRHQVMELMTMEDNRRFSRRKKIREGGYPTYVNFDAIEVGFTEAIPADYEGIMGVPISFLDRYNPDQFEIVANMDDHAQLKELGVEPLSEEFIAGYRAAGGTGAQRAGGYWMGLEDPHRFPFKRILIRNKHPEVNGEN